MRSGRVVLKDTTLGVDSDGLPYICGYSLEEDEELQRNPPTFISPLRDQPKSPAPSMPMEKLQALIEPLERFEGPLADAWRSAHSKLKEMGDGMPQASKRTYQEALQIVKTARGTVLADIRIINSVATLLKLNERAIAYAEHLDTLKGPFCRLLAHQSTNMPSHPSWTAISAVELRVRYPRVWNLINSYIEHAELAQKHPWKAAMLAEVARETLEDMLALDVFKNQERLLKDEEKMLEYCIAKSEL